MTPIPNPRPLTSDPNGFDLDPSFHPFSPIVYVLWADGVLDAEEIRTVRAGIVDAPTLSETQREHLVRWLDPRHPPSAEQLEALRSRVREIWERSETSECPSLATLGREIARAEGIMDEDGGLRSALESLESSMQVLGREAVRELLDLPTGEAAPSAGTDLDSSAIHRYVDGDHFEIRQSVLRLLEEPVFHIPMATPTSEYRERVLGAVRRLADRGYGSIAFPEAHGGRGDPASSIAAFETLAFGDTSVLIKFGVQFGLWGGSVFQLGTESHHRRYLRPIGALDLPGCYAMTELGHGSNVRDIETVATYDETTAEFVLHTPTLSARKWWIGNAALHGRSATVFAQLEVGDQSHGVHAFVVPIRDDRGEALPGVFIDDCGEKVGLNGIDNGILGFDRVRIPRENLLDRFAQVTEDGRYVSPIASADRRFFTMLGTLVAGRISIAAGAVSIAKVGLTTAIRYTDRRPQFGPAGRAEVPILDYRVMQRNLLPGLATAYGLTFATREIVRRYAALQAGAGDPDERERDTRQLEVFAAGLKAYASDFAVETIQAAREACGGQGYLAENRLGRLRNDVDIFTTFEGANTVLLQLAAKGLLSRYRNEMGDLKFWGIVRYIAEQAGTRVTELNPVIVRKTDEDHLLDMEFHRAAFAYREERLLSSAARRLKSFLDDGVDSFEALNRTQDHLVTLARAHIERRVIDHFAAGVNDAPEGVREPLGRLEALYALSRFEAHSGWYQESGYMEGVKTRAIRAQVNRLLELIRPDAVALVDAFGIPGGVLRAPAGLPEG